MKYRSKRLILFLVLILIIPSITCTILKPKSEAPQRQPGKDTIDTSGDALPDASGDEIEITQTTTYQDEFGYWNLHGLLTNSADYPVGSIELDVQSDGASVIDPTFIGVYGIAPGEIHPFNIRLPLTITSVEGLEVNVSQTQRVLLDPVKLDLIQSKLAIAENGTVTLVGEVQNNTNNPALIYSAKAGLFSVDDELISTASCQVCPGYLAPGDQAPAQFLIFGQPVDEVVDHYDFYIGGDKGPEVEKLTVDFIEPVHSFMDAAGGFHLLGDLQNNTDKILALNLLGSFYNQEGEIVGASSNSLPFKSLSPGETAPYELTFLNPIDNVANWSIQVDMARSKTRDDRAVQLLATTTGITREKYLWTVSGDAENNNDKSLQFITVVVGIREIGTGKLVGLASNYMAGDFPAGSIIEYRVEIVPDPSIDPDTLEEFVIVLGE